MPSFIFFCRCSKKTRVLEGSSDLPFFLPRLVCRRRRRRTQLKNTNSSFFSRLLGIGIDLNAIINDGNSANWWYLLFSSSSYSSFSSAAAAAAENSTFGPFYSSPDKEHHSRFCFCPHHRLLTIYIPFLLTISTHCKRSPFPASWNASLCVCVFGFFPSLLQLASNGALNVWFIPGIKERRRRRF